MANDEFYQNWLGKSEMGGEPNVDCNQCAMIHPTGLTRDPGPFHADLKCCTYVPYIPNFSLGAMIKKHPKIYEKLARDRRGELTPVGFVPKQSTRAKNFGQNSDDLCPLFDSQAKNCGSWEHRPGVCQTYFCKSSRGVDGFQAWQTREDFLNYFEWTFAHDLAWESGLTNDDLKSFVPDAKFYLDIFAMAQKVDASQMKILLGEDKRDVVTNKS